MAEMAYFLKVLTNRSYHISRNMGGEGGGGNYFKDSHDFFEVRYYILFVYIFVEL